jgi:hypothetical protein
MKRLVTILAAFSIASCATCEPVTFLRATSEVPARDLAVHQERDRIVFKVGRYASLSIASCIFEYSLVSGSICVYVRVANAKRARFVDTTFVLTDTRSGTTSKFRIARFDYDVICNVSLEGSKSCSSTEDPPVTGPVQMEELRRFACFGTATYIRRYSFNASEEFYGAKGKEGTAFSRLFEKRDNWREYRAVVVRESLLGSTFILNIPALVVDGTTFSFPSVQLETVTEEICVYPEAM